MHEEVTNFNKLRICINRYQFEKLLSDINNYIHGRECQLKKMD